MLALSQAARFYLKIFVQGAWALGLMSCFADNSAANKAAEKIPKSTPYNTTSKDSTPTSPVPSVPSPTASEAPTIPSVITGTLLLCVNDNISGDSAYVVCRVQDAATNQKVDLATGFSNHSFSLTGTIPFAVSVTEFPASSKWHVRYRVTAPTNEEVKANIAATSYKYQGTSTVDNKAVTFDTKSIPTYPGYASKINRIRSLKLFNGADRCIDSASFRNLPDYVWGASCNTTPAQDWTLTADGKLQLNSGLCIRVGTDSVTYAKPCDSTSIVKFELVGEQIRQVDTNKCITALEKFDSYNLVLSDCATGDDSQRWKFETL